MSFWQRIREWLGAGPERVPDVASFDDARLRALWKERSELTEAAREAVRAECARRGLQLRGLAPRATEEPGATGTSRRVKSPRPVGNLIDVRPGVGVLLQTTPGRFALIVLPRWSPTPVELPEGLALDAIVVCNHEPRGWLDVSRWAAVAAVSSAAIHATAAGPIDRAPGSSGGGATLLQSELRLGNLTLRRMTGLPEVLRATWDGAAVTAAIGPMMPSALVHAQPASAVYVGSIELDGDLAWSALLAAAHGSAMMAIASLGPQGAGPQVILVGDAVGTPLSRHIHVRPGLGISVIGEECPVLPESVELLGLVVAGRWDLVGSATSEQMEDVMEHLLVEGRTDDARRLIASGVERGAEDPSLHRLRGTLHAIDLELDEAIAALERDGHPLSSLIASGVHAARRDWAASERAARSVLAIAPHDALAIAALARCLWLSGRGDEARVSIDEAPGLSLTGTQASDLYALVDEETPSEPSRDVGLVHLAARALRAARRASDRERAVTAYRRALELDPYCAAAKQALSALEAS